MNILDFLQHGLLDFSLLQILVTLIVTTQITILAVTLYLHREQTHKGLILHPILKHYFRFHLWMTTGMLTKEWVAVHRKHHAKCETEDDPHSPQHYGIRKVLFSGVGLYEKERLNQQTLDKYGKGTPNDWVENFVYSKFHFLGVVLMLLIDIALFGVIGITFWAIQIVWIPFFAAGVINGLGHWSGYRNYATDDCSTNLTRFGFIIGGEELHNNHHAFPSSCKFAHTKGEYDWGWIVIKFLNKVGLAKIKKTVPELEQSNISSVDLDAIKAMLTHKVNLLQVYVKDVIKPAIAVEYIHHTKKFKKSSDKFLNSLSIDWRFLDDDARDLFKQYINISPTVETIIKFRDDLKEIWESRGQSTEQMIAEIKEWCHNAEKSGVEVLQTYAQKLQTYRLKST
ncbi:Fatty acid desaturase; Delta-9 fatty acid desaturase [hydrothermal vent metagenome]|uniref:Fatty acid desaturase Delta-9 fatty acid desaturase n=1 Tax=hydrothermal vent metagenome TaxID=652676 RepID=A0A3B0WXA7_9ZZZZ